MGRRIAPFASVASHVASNSFAARAGLEDLCAIHSLRCLAKAGRALGPVLAKLTEKLYLTGATGRLLALYGM